MEVFVSAPSFRFSNIVFPHGSVVGDVLNQYVQRQGVSSDDFYIITNGRLSCLKDPLQHGAVYHLEPRLCGGKGGFGSMLRALGAQIEKTTNREACRDLSGRRLRDVNHEKEMAEWLKKQADREVEKEQRRLERLQKKLTEPKHQFTDPEFQQQCHDLSERLEDSVLKGLQASSSSLVTVGDVSAVKRPNSDQSQQQQKKQKKMGSTAAAHFWTGLDELQSSEEDDDDVDEEDFAPASSTSCGATVVTMMMHGSSSADHTCLNQISRPSESHKPSKTCTDQSSRPAESHEPSKTCTDQSSRPAESHEPSKTCTDQSSRPSEGHEPTNTITDGTTRISEGQEPTKTCTDVSIRTSEESSCSEQQLTYPPLQLSSVSSVDQLESLGLDILKQELMSRGLKCGGALSERAARLFSVRGLSPDQIDPVLLAKPGKAKRK